MSIERLGAQTGRPERRGNRVEQLQAALATIASEVNAQVEKEHGIGGLLDADCAIAMQGYATEEGGIYPSEEVARDMEEVRRMEWNFTGAANPNVREFYRDEYHAETEEEVIAAWKANKVKEKSGQTEMAVTALLYKMLGHDFIVARTAAYDDYKGGVDNVILDKRTGAVVCAFDEIHEDKTGRRLGEKRGKVQKLVGKGGARIRYGISMEGEDLKRTKLENLPVFYLSLTDADLEDLVAGIGDGLANVSAGEERVFAKLIDSLRQQAKLLDEWHGTPKAVKAKLDNFAQSLQAIMQSTGEQAPPAT